MIALARVVVCVTRQTTCERLIHTGARFVAEHGGELSVVHVAPRGATFLGTDSDGEALEYLYGVAKQCSADISVIRAQDVTRALVRHAKMRRFTHVILGVSPTGVQDTANQIAAELEKELGGAQVIIVPA